MQKANRKDIPRYEVKNGTNHNEINFDGGQVLLLSNFVKNVNKKFSLTNLIEVNKTRGMNDIILLIENYYTSIKFDNCNINIFALKKLIKWNLKSLRFIHIKSCSFYLSDYDANEKKDPAKNSNSRMLQEIDFVYHIQTFQFFDIEEIEIVFKQHQKYIDVESGNKVIQKDRKLKPQQDINEILSQRQHDQQSKQSQKQSIDIVQNDMNQPIPIITNKELIKEFACESNCRLINYEKVEKLSFIKNFSKENQQIFAQELIWGDLLDPRKMEVKLNNDKLEEIQQNLRFYKTYTKYALMENKLLILGDVLYNNVSVQQLYNLIQLNYRNINCLIFKDTGKIPGKTFSDLMNQLFIIPKIDEISFLSSVVEEESFKDLQYLIGWKKVQFMVIYRSHFLQSEIDALFKMHATKRAPLIYTVLDLYSKKYYEFTPYAFQSNLLNVNQSKADNNSSMLLDTQNYIDDEEKIYELMMDVELLYNHQQEYPKLIYNRIIFYQGKNLSIMSKNVSDKNLFKSYNLQQLLIRISILFCLQNRYWVFIQNISENNKNEIERFKKAKQDIKQEELIRDLDIQLKQDDLNVVNCGLIKNLIGLINEEELRQEYYKMYESQKSYINLKRKYPIKVVERIRFKEKYYLAASLAYLMGFTKIHNQFLYFYINNQELHESLCSNRKDYSNLQTEEYSLIIKESVKIGLDIDAVQILQSCIQYDKLTHLNLDGIRENTTFQYLNEVFISCVNLKCLTMRECLLNLNKINQINFKKISSNLIELDMSKNRDIDDFDFLNHILMKATDLRKLILQDMQLNKSRLEKVDFKLMNENLEYLNLSENNLIDCINQISELLQQTTQLKQLILQQCELNIETLQLLKFPQFLEYLNISKNNDIDLNQYINILPQISTPYLKLLDFKEIFVKNQKDEKPNPSQQINEKLYSRIEEIIFNRNQIEDVQNVNQILSLCKNLKNLTFSYQNSSDLQISQLNIDHLYERMIKINLSYNYQINKCDFLNKLFEKMVNLSSFIMKYCALNDEKIKNVNFSLLTEHLCEFDISGNYQIQDLKFINDVMKKCKSIKILSLEKMWLTDEKIKNIDFTLISSQLEELNISQNEKLTRFYFMNEIFRKAKGLKRMNLNGIHLDESQIDQISFDNISMELESFKIDEKKGTDKKSFTDWLIKKLNRYLNIYRFSKHYANVESYPFINYFGVTQSFNLTQYRMSKEEIKFKQKKMKEVQTLTNILGLDHIPQSISQQQQLKQQMNQQGRKVVQQAHILNMYRLSKQQEGSESRVHLSEAVNIFYFYSFFNKLQQIINNQSFTKKEIQSINQSPIMTPKQQKTKGQWSSFLDKIIEDQNIYVDIKYLLLQYIDDRKLLESLDLDQIQPNDLIQYIKILDISNKKCTQSSFIQFAFSHCNQIEKMYLQNMQQLLQDFIKNNLFKNNIQFCQFLKLEEINMSQNKTNLSEFLNALVKNSPNLKILNLSNCNLKTDTLFNVELLSTQLQVLNLSENRHLVNLSFLNKIFQRCKALKYIDLSNMHLTSEQVDIVKFEDISQELEHFNLSNNNILNSKSLLIVINSLLKKCKKLLILNLSNLNIDHNTIQNISIQFSELSPYLKEINLSYNSIVFFMEFLASIIKSAPNIEIIDLSYQQHTNSYESQPVTVPPNKLKVLNISGNTIHNSFQYAPELISKSSCFKKLIVQDFNLQKSRLNQLIDKICDNIEELDISNNDKITDLTSFNNLNRKNNFKVLIARNTCLNNYLLNQLEKDKMFTNLETLDFSYNVSILDYNFFNSLFKIAKNLISLNMSYMQATQINIEEIDFSNTPQTLQSFDISGNDEIKNFTFLNLLFHRTQKSLKNLYLSSINADDSQFENINFNILENQIEFIDFSKNPNLVKVIFLSKLLNNQNTKLQKIKIDRFVFDITNENSFSQVEKLVCDHIQYKYNFFTHERYVVNINIIKFIKFLQLEYKKNYLMQNEVEERFGTIFQLFLKQLLKNQSQKKNLQVILHFFFLLFNEERIKFEELSEDFFIFSPYSMFQKNKTIDFKEFRNNEENMSFDSYNLTFFDLDMVEDGMKYIFGYDKFQFPNFNEFYFQDFKKQNETNGDIHFLQRIHDLIIKKKAEKAFLPTKLFLNEESLKPTNLNEFQILYLINRAPPSIMQLKQMSIQFVKSWYVINYYAPLSCNTQISVNFELIENTSIGNFLTLNAYKWLVQNYREKNIIRYIKYHLGYIGYSICKIFYTLPVQFRFDHSVILLDQQLDNTNSSTSRRYYILKMLFPLYQFVCIFGVVYFSLADELGCGQGISWYSYVMYGIYGVLTFILEADYFLQCLKYVKHLIPEFKPDCSTQLINKQINQIKQMMVDWRWLNLWYLNYSISFIQSQLTRFDYFTDIGFLYSLHSCGEDVLFWISFSGLALSFVFNMMFYFYTFVGGNTYEKLATGRIDKLYQVCSLISFWAVAELLNIVSPSNSITYRNKMYNQKIINTFIGILFENIPQIIIQIIFLAKKNVLSSNVLFSIITSILMFIINLYKFLTVIPSRLGQEDFNALNAHKKNEILPLYQKNLQEFESNLLKYNLVEQLKCIKSTVHYKKLLTQSSKNYTPSQIKRELNIAKELRKFQHNLDLIEYLFGNIKFIDSIEQMEEYNTQSEEKQNNQHQQKNDEVQLQPKSNYLNSKQQSLDGNNHEISNQPFSVDHKETHHLLKHDDQNGEQPHDFTSDYLKKSNKVINEKSHANVTHAKQIHIQHSVDDKSSHKNQLSSKTNLTNKSKNN